MGKDLDDLIKSLPPEKRAVYDKAQSLLQGLEAKEQSARQNVSPGHVANQNAIQHDAPQEPKGFMHDGKSMQDAYDQTGPTSQAKGNEIDQMISDRDKAESKETGQQLTQQHEVRHQKEDELER